MKKSTAANGNSFMKSALNWSLSSVSTPVRTLSGTVEGVAGADPALTVSSSSSTGSLPLGEELESL